MMWTYVVEDDHVIRYAGQCFFAARAVLRGSKVIHAWRNGYWVGDVNFEGDWEWKTRRFDREADEEFKLIRTALQRTKERGRGVSELVERLRSVDHGGAELECEAANEIEQLEAEIELLQAELAQWHRCYGDAPPVELTPEDKEALASLPPVRELIEHRQKGEKWDTRTKQWVPIDPPDKLWDFYPQ